MTILIYYTDLYSKSFLHSFTTANSIATEGVLRPFGRFGTAIFVVLITVLGCAFLLPLFFLAGSFLQFGFYLPRSSCFCIVRVGRHVATSKLAMACLEYGRDVRRSIYLYIPPLGRKLFFNFNV